ncbi:hypothetical protein [Hyphomicrobium sp.]|uniref:ATP-dependent DNA ligase n=1 Tax=Hyphomicrobium sp. TaxID=82 RepID=UPI001DD7FA4F|nr:hypothetical protein [Hyphomicrobium sp.]MBY0561515.1 hypothetical protein [Hyphomicrobium sp.]
MNRQFEPMLAYQENPDLTALAYPKLVSLKIDGFRCLIRNGLPMTRELKIIRNRHIRKAMQGMPDGSDGELIVGAPTDPDVFNKTQRAVTTEAGQPDFSYWVFDDFSVPGEPFRMRLERLKQKLAGVDLPWLRIVAQRPAYGHAEIEPWMDQAVAAGYEGLILRDPEGHYKFGRSTLKEELLLKFKRWHDSEGVIVGCYEQRKNTNVAETSATGKTKRSTKKAGMVPAGTLGGVHVLWHNGRDKVVFDLAVGGTDAYAQELWDTRAELHGKLVSFKYQRIGSKGKPRHPTWKGLRSKDDVGSSA